MRAGTRESRLVEDGGGTCYPHAMSSRDNQRVYSDEEFALILRTAAELANREELPHSSPDGMTLAEMKSAAAEAGLDPVLVEQAARMVVEAPRVTALDRLMGGPVRHKIDVHFPAKLDENSAALLLSAVRIRASLPGHRDRGHSSAMGMTWHDGGATESLGVTASPEEDGTTVSVVVDRRGTLLLLVMFSGVAMFLSTLFALFALLPEAPALGAAGFIAGIGGTLAAARSYWSSSTRRIRERLASVTNAIGRTLK
jgi:hypothetical protein